MKQILKYTVIGLCLLFASAFIVLVQNWNIDKQYSIKFSGKMDAGTFSGLTGTISFDKTNLSQSSMDVAVDVKTIHTGSETKDKHAKDKDWLDATDYPAIKFTSTEIKQNGDGFLVLGNLEMHGTKKLIEIPFQFIRQGNKAFFKGVFKVNRKDYGINGNLFGFAVGEVFDVTLNIPVTQQ